MKILIVKNVNSQKKKKINVMAASVLHEIKKTDIEPEQKAQSKKTFICLRQNASFRSQTKTDGAAFTDFTLTISESPSAANRSQGKEIFSDVSHS